jgi:hypothetical protein
VYSFDTSSPAPTSPSVPKSLPASVNPVASIAPSTTTEDDCFVKYPNLAACNAAALGDINKARAGEGLGNLALPADYYTLSMSGQILAVANAERSSRGLPVMPENGSLDNMAMSGAEAGQDPTGPSGYSWGSNIAWGYPTALAADFGWMYDDGPGSPNINCTSAGAPGCWGHRHNILVPWAGAAGAAAYNNSGTVQLTELFAAGY